MFVFLSSREMGSEQHIVMKLYRALRQSAFRPIPGTRPKLTESATRQRVVRALRRLVESPNANRSRARSALAAKHWNETYSGCFSDLLNISIFPTHRV